MPTARMAVLGVVAKARRPRCAGPSRSGRFPVSNHGPLPQQLDQGSRPFACSGPIRALRPELVPGVEVLKVLSAISDLAVLELEDNAAGDIEVLAVSVSGAALDADHAVLAICGHVLQLRPEAPSRFLRQLAEVSQRRAVALVVAGHRAPARQVPHSVIHELVERVHVPRVERPVCALHDRDVFIWSHCFSPSCDLLRSCRHGVHAAQTALRTSGSTLVLLCAQQGFSARAATGWASVYPSSTFLQGGRDARNTKPCKRGVGDPGLEPGTSSLSEKRSNRLS